MTINWYPGHMHKANKAMREALPDIDLVIELLDCRLPMSSQNPLIADLCKNKPCIKVLSKADLADDAVTALWQTHFEANAQVKTLRSEPNRTDTTSTLLRLIDELVPEPAKSRTHVLAMISGIPNVGKSTLINTLVGRKAAHTGNEPAITKGLQRIRLHERLILLDTPGILWPKLHNQHSAYRLAASGAIKDTAIDATDVAFFLADFLLQHYPQQLRERYSLDALPSSELALLEIIGRQRGCLRGGGHVELDKVASILLTEFRSGQLGRISMETPQSAQAEAEQVAIALAQKQKEKQKKTQERQQARKNKRREH